MSIHSGGDLKPLVPQLRRGNVSPRFVGLSLRFFLILLVTSVFAVGCQTKPVVIGDVMLPYTTLKSRIINAMPTGVRSQSTNGREITSNFYSPSDMFIVVTEKDKDAERAYAVVTILNSSRPFDLNIQVFTESRTPKGAYEPRGEDPRLTRKMIQHLREALTEKKGDRNVVDEIRAF